MATAATVRPKVDVFPHANYIVSAEAEEVEGAPPKPPLKDQAPAAKLHRMKQRYDQQGVISSVECVMLVNLHSHPHVLLLQHKKTKVYRLPGGKCRVGEDHVECLHRKLNSKLRAGETPQSVTSDASPLRGDAGGGQSSEMLFRVGELLSEWVRPNFDPLMYPYRPPHVTKEKEVRAIYLVQLAPEGVLTVRRDFECVAIPLFELHDNTAK